MIPGSMLLRLHGVGREVGVCDGSRRRKGMAFNMGWAPPFQDERQETEFKRQQDAMNIKQDRVAGGKFQLFFSSPISSPSSGDAGVHFAPVHNPANCTKPTVKTKLTTGAAMEYMKQSGRVLLALSPAGASLSMFLLCLPLSVREDRYKVGIVPPL
jgi:hypothetical protein